MKALAAGMALVAPVTAQVPAGAEFRQLIAIVIILAACFIAGLVVRTGPGGRGIEKLQRRLLEKIPGYQLLRGVISRLSGDETSTAFEPALVELGDALVPALIVEELPDGQFVVLVPSVPTPVSGALYVLPATRVHRIGVPLTKLMKVYSKFGEGTGDLVAAMRTRQGQDHGLDQRAVQDRQDDQTASSLRPPGSEKVRSRCDLAVDRHRRSIEVGTISRFWFGSGGRPFVGQCVPAHIRPSPEP